MKDDVVGHLGETLWVLMGAMALLLGLIGIYGVVSYAVQQRRCEIGIAAKERHLVTLAHELLGEIAALFERPAEGQGVAIELDIPEVPVDVRGRADWIQQALLNLVTNALEAMPGGGTLSVQLAANHDVAVIHVCDTGSGIPEAALSRIWEPYFTTKPTGHGLGLYVVRRVARAHGGQVSARVTPSGTCFSLTLPCAVSA